jgi:hypothetical protein
MANWQEYIAGTNPTNAASYLKVAYIWSGITSNQQVRLEFNAVSNKTYSIFASESPGSAAWTRVADIVAGVSNRVMQVSEERPVNGPPRFYRLATPRAP